MVIVFDTWSIHCQIIEWMCNKLSDKFMYWNHNLGISCVPNGKTMYDGAHDIILLVSIATMDKECYTFHFAIPCS